MAGMPFAIGREVTYNHGVLMTLLLRLMVRPLITDFRHHFQFERGRAVGTVIGYCGDLEQLITEMEEAIGRELVVEDLVQDRLQDLLTSLSAEGMHPST